MTLTPIPGGEGVPPEPDWEQMYADVLDISLASEQFLVAGAMMMAVAVAAARKTAG